MQNKLAKKFIEKHAGKKGTSAFAWILMGIGLMFILFVPVDMALQSIQSHEFNGVLDNAVSSAITHIEEDQIRTGDVVINHDRATEAVYEVLATSYNIEYERLGPLNYRFIPDSIEDSKLTKIPDVEVQFIDFTTQEIKNNVTKQSQPFGVFDAEEPSQYDGYVLENIKEDTIAIRVKASFPSQILTRLDGFTFDRVSAAKASLTGGGS